MQANFYRCVEKGPAYSATLNQPAHNLCQYNLTVHSQTSQGFQDIPSHEDFSIKMLHLSPTF